MIQGFFNKVKNKIIHLGSCALIKHVSALQLVEETPTPCMNCGAKLAILFHTKTKPDFDLKILKEENLIRQFSFKLDGICTGCGVFQCFTRFTNTQLQIINKLGKDISTNDLTYQENPSISLIEKHNQELFEKRIQQWEIYFNFQKFNPKKCLFIRTFFGGGVNFIKRKYDCEIMGLDMSSICNQIVSNLVKGYQVIPGLINGKLEGEFLKMKSFDAVFVHHVLTHACNVHQMLSQIHNLVVPNGFVVFTHEIQHKPYNPFHMLHLSEFQLHQLLLQHFKKVDRIDNCDLHWEQHINPYTQKNDSPDLVAWVS